MVRGEKYMRNEGIRTIARRWILMGLTIAGASLVAGCGKSASVNYRMIVEVEDGDVVRRGSSVWRFKITENIPLGGRSFKPEFWGEAITVDIPGKGALFVLPQGRSVEGNLRGNNPEMLPEHKFGKDVERDTGGNYSGDRRLKWLTTISSRYVGRAKTLECPEFFESYASGRKDRLTSDCLFMVRFRDIKKPATVEAVDPANLAASFGKGVKLKRILIQITDDDVTTGIEKKLPSLLGYLEKRSMFSGRGFSARRDPKTEHLLADQLGPGEFSTALR